MADDPETAAKLGELLIEVRSMRERFDSKDKEITSLRERLQVAEEALGTSRESAKTWQEQAKLLVKERNVQYARLTDLKGELRGHIVWLRKEVKWWEKSSHGRSLMKTLADDDALTEQDGNCMCNQGLDGEICCPVHSLLAISRHPDPEKWLTDEGDE